MLSESKLLMLAVALTACATRPVEPPAKPNAPAEREGPRFVALDITTSYGCAVTEDGQLWCWGEDPARELGLRPGTSAWTEAARVELDFAVEQVVTELSQTCVLGRDRELRCWRSKWDEREAMQPTILAWAAGAVSIGSGLCARFADGSFACANTPDLEQVTQHEPANTALDVHDSVWLDPLGRIYMFGAPARFLLTLSNREWPEHVSPPAIEIGRIDDAQLLRGECVLAAGRIHCPPPLAIYRPTQTPPYLYAEIAGVERVRDFDVAGHGCGVREEGDVVCWGDGGVGQRGDGASTRSRPPVAVAGIVEARAVAVAPGLSCAADRDGLACWGTFDVHEPVVERVHVLDGAVAIVVEHDYSCATLEAGEHRCWGQYSAEFVSRDEVDLSVTTQPTPVDFAVGTVAELAGHCVLGVDGELDCKTLPSPYSDSFCPTGPRELGDFRRADPWCPALQQYAAGSAIDLLNHGGDTCVISTAGFECLGVALLDRGLPALEHPTDVLLRAHDLLCAIHAGGELGCWPPHRQDIPPLSAPIPQHHDFVALAGNGPYACALRSVGEVWCWLEPNTPGFALALPEIATIEATESYGAWDSARLWVLTRDGRAGSVRVDQSGELAPEWLELTDVVELDGGRNHVCLRQRDGAVTCVGHNSVGQLARMPSTYMATPTRVRTN
jgi:hypothetical protein